MRICSVILFIGFVFYLPTTETFSGQVDNEFSKLCQQAGVNTNSSNMENKCTCQLFQVSWMNVSMSLCGIVKTPLSPSIRLSTITLNGDHNGSYLPEITQKFCSYFHISSSECHCSLTSIFYNNNIKLNACSSSSSLTSSTTSLPLLVNNVHQLCELFNIQSENCSCVLFNDSDICKHLNERDIIIRSIRMHRYQRIYAILAAIAAVIGILGNSLVVMVSKSRQQHREKRRRRNTTNFNRLIRMLAFYDLAFAFFQLLNVFPKMWTAEWIYGEIMCNLFKCVESLSAMLAAGVILIISIERYIKIFYPLYDLTQFKLSILLVVHCVMACAVIAPLLAHFYVDDTLKVCLLKWPHKQSDLIFYDGVVFTLFYFIPILIVGYIYFMIIRFLKANNTRDFASRDSIYQSNQCKENHRHRGIIKSMMSVVVVFILFVFPKHVVNFYFGIKGWFDHVPAREMGVSTYFILMYIAHIPYLFHVCANPVIYSITDPKWRIDLKRLAHRLRFCRKRAGINGGKAKSFDIDMTTLTSVGHLTLERREEEDLNLLVNNNKKNSNDTI